MITTIATLKSLKTGNDNTFETLIPFNKKAFQRMVYKIKQWEFPYVKINQIVWWKLVLNVSLHLQFPMNFEMWKQRWTHLFLFLIILSLLKLLLIVIDPPTTFTCQSSHLILFEPLISKCISVCLLDPYCTCGEGSWAVMRR